MSKETQDKHTPGPWIVDERHVHCQHGFTNKDPRLMLESDVVCEIDTSCREMLTDTDKANLRLIAAAPELLEALRRVVPWLAKHIADNHHLESVAPNDALGALRQAQAAIQKATQS